MENSNVYVGNCLILCFCILFYTWLYNFQGTNINVLLLATIDREKFRIEVYPISLYVQGWHQRYGWYGHGHANFCVFYWTSQSHFQGACNIHARSDLVKLRSLVSTGEHGLL